MSIKMALTIFFSLVALDIVISIKLAQAQEYSERF